MAGVLQDKLRLASSGYCYGLPSSVGRSPRIGRLVFGRFKDRWSSSAAPLGSSSLPPHVCDYRETHVAASDHFEHAFLQADFRRDQVVAACCRGRVLCERQGAPRALMG